MARQKKQKLKRRADGRYCCRWHGKQFMGRTEEEALNAREAYKRLVLSGLKPSDMPFSAYAEKWLKTHKNGIMYKELYGKCTFDGAIGCDF